MAEGAGSAPRRWPCPSNSSASLHLDARPLKRSANMSVAAPRALAGLGGGLNHEGIVALAKFASSAQKIQPR
eukprot:2657134-Pyramimonas_sp.AAC.1